MKPAIWYKLEVAKLLAIAMQDDSKDVMHKSYLKEKLERIMKEVGIGIHPTLKPVVKKLMEE